MTKQKVLIELMHLRVVIDHAVSLPNAWQEDGEKGERHTKKNEGWWITGEKCKVRCTEMRSKVGE